MFHPLPCKELSRFFIDTHAARINFKDLVLMLLDIRCIGRANYGPYHLVNSIIMIAFSKISGEWSWRSSLPHELALVHVTQSAVDYWIALSAG
jgi:hypothetical protein